MIRCALLLTWGLLVGSVGTAAASIEDARTSLERAIVTLDHVAELPEPGRTESLTQLRAELKKETAHALGAWIAEPLEQTPANLPSARLRLVQAVDALGAPSDSDRVAAQRQSLAAVMAGPPFTTRDIKSVAPEWLIPIALVLEWLATTVWNAVRWPFDRLGDIWHGFVHGPAFLPIISLLAVAGGIALVLLYRRGLRAALVTEVALQEAGVALPPTSTQAADSAQRFAARGQYREACHFMFLSALLWIEEHGQTRFDRSATNWEHLQRLGVRSPLVPPFRLLINRFDRLWYGQADVTESDYRDLEVLTARLRGEPG